MTKIEIVNILISNSYTYWSEKDRNYLLKMKKSELQDLYNELCQVDRW